MMSITIHYDPVERKVSIDPNDFTTFEAFGILEAAKVMIATHWMEDDEDEDGGIAV